MNDVDAEAWRWPEVTLPVGKGRTTTPRPPETLKRSHRNVAAGARLIQAEGLDSKSAAEVSATLADALEELHRLERGLDRRIRREQTRRAWAQASAFAYTW